MNKTAVEIEREYNGVVSAQKQGKGNNRALKGRKREGTIHEMHEAMNE